VVQHRDCEPGVDLLVQAAWDRRVDHYATMLSRTVPDMPCTALLEPEEWQALYCAIHCTPTLPPTPPTLRQVVHWIARLGGFLERRGDGEPGVTVCGKVSNISPI
jgi:hypothetical protein